MKVGVAVGALDSIAALECTYMDHGGASVHVKGDFSSERGRAVFRVGDVPDPGDPRPFIIPIPSTTAFSSSQTAKY